MKIYKVGKFSPKYSARVLHQRPDAESSCWSPGIHGGLQVPHFYLPVVGSTDNPLAVESDAADQLLVSLQDPETGPALYVPEPDGVVGAAADDQSIVVLEAGDASLVSIQSSHKLAGAGGPDLRQKRVREMKIETRGPYLDRSVSAGRDDVLLIKVDNIDGSSGTANYMNYNIGRLNGVPIPVLRFPGC